MSLARGTEKLPHAPDALQAAKDGVLGADEDSDAPVGSVQHC